MRISSRQNSIVNRFKAVARGDVEGMLLLDGVHLVQDALAAGIQIANVVIDAGAVERRDISRLAEELRERGVDPIIAAAPVMSAISPVRSPTGIVAIAQRPERDLADFYTQPAPLVLIANDIQDPGNLGAIVRVAEAGGATSVLAAGSSADPFGWKALRGSMGSALRLPVDRVGQAETAIAEARRRKCRIIATVPRDGRSMYDIDLSGAAAVLVGGEGPGLPDSLIESADERLSIPMQPDVESLNAAATAALIVYEARRQRATSRT